MLKRLFGRGGNGTPDWIAGGLYSVRDGEMFRAAKVLVVDRRAAHVRVYKPRYVSRPVHIESDELTLGTIHDADGFGIGHLPLGHEAFAAWQPVLIRVDEVQDSELDGYEMWRDDGGGVWDLRALS
jgi:hypothetical protein